MARIAPNSDDSFFAPLINEEFTKPLGFAEIKNVKYLGEVNVTVPKFQGTTTVIRTFNSITLSNVSISGSGILYSFIEKVKAIADRGDREVIGAPFLMPDFKQLRLGTNLTSYPNVWDSKIDIFFPGKQLDITYGNLEPATIYRVYYIASSEDPILPVTTEVNYILTETYYKLFSSRLYVGVTLALGLFYALVM